MQHRQLPVRRILRTERAGDAVGDGGDQPARLLGAVVRERRVAGGVCGLGVLAVPVELVGGNASVGVGVSVEPAQVVVPTSDGGRAGLGGGHFSVGRGVARRRGRDRGGTVVGRGDRNTEDASRAVVLGGRGTRRRGPRHSLGDNSLVAPSVVGGHPAFRQVGGHPGGVVPGDGAGLPRHARVASPFGCVSAGRVGAVGSGRVVDRLCGADIGAGSSDSPLGGRSAGRVVDGVGRERGAAGSGVKHRGRGFA